MATHKADVKIMISVEFDDDGVTDPKDQAIDKAVEDLPLHIAQDADIEIVGEVEKL